jgi:hypothetical protein
MKVEASSDGLRLRMQIDQELTATETDTLLRQIALARAGMKPEVPHSTGHLAHSETQVLVEDMPALSIAARAGGGFRLWLRHRGFNWLGYQIDNRTAAGLSSFIRKHIGEGPGIQLVNEEPPNRH